MASAYIPASAFVNVNPGTINAGGNALALSGLFLTNGTRTPIGSVLSFPSAPSVGAYYGLSSQEYANSQIYFAGATKATATPGAMLFAQYNQNAVPAFLRGGSLATMSLASLQALSGVLTVTVSGVVKTSATITMSAVTSFSNAATLITTQFAAYDGITAATSTIAAGTALVGCTGAITLNVLTVTALTSGTIVAGGVLTGTGVTVGTTVVSQLTGTTGGIGTYLVSVSQTVSSTALTQAYGLLTVVGVTSGFLAVGQVIGGGTITAGTTITAQVSGTTGGAGTYVTSGGAQTVAATTVSAGQLICTFDSVANAFVLTGGTPGVLGTIGYASGTLSGSLDLTLALGAVTSQGAAAAVPSTFMSGIIATTTQFASWTTIFDPDNGIGNAQKQLLAAWNTAQNYRYAYVTMDLDITPTLSNNAVTSLGNILTANGNSGTVIIWAPSYNYKNAFVCGAIASVDFTATNGATSFAYLSQTGLTPDVTSQSVLSNLDANNYDCYLAAANASNNWNFLYPGSITGPYATIENFINQIWMNSNLQTSIMTLLTTVKAVPYVQQGYGLISAACQGPINSALNFGAIQKGVVLSPLQVSEINYQAGKQVAQYVVNAGYYLQVLDPGAVVRGQGGSPIVNLWYASGGSVLQINMGSINVL